jgi:hypothetical protein
VALSAKSELTLVSPAFGARGTDAEALPSVTVSGVTIGAKVGETSLLGFRFDADLGVNAHLARVLRDAGEGVRRLEVLRAAGAGPMGLYTAYHSYVLSRMMYAAPAYINLGWNAPAPRATGDNAGARGVQRGAYVPAGAAPHFPAAALEPLERLHGRAARAIAGTAATASTALCLREAGLVPFAILAANRACRMDEVIARLGLPALASVRGNREPVLTSLPFAPAWAGSLEHRVSFVLDLGTRVTRDSPLKVKFADNCRRIRAALSLASPTAVLATDGSVLSGADVDLPGTSPSAGAAVLFSASAAGLNEELGTATAAAGQYACSYSAECRGAEAGLDLVLGRAQPGGTLFWLVDNRGLVSALATGSLRSRAWAEAHIWLRLLRLAEAGWTIVVVWVFSHCDEPDDEAHAAPQEDCAEARLLCANTRADQLASAAAVELAGSAAERAAPLWYVDAARARTSEASAEYAASPAVLATLQEHGSALGHSAGRRDALGQDDRC